MSPRVRLWLTLVRGWRLPVVLGTYVVGAVALAVVPRELTLPQVFALNPVIAPTTIVSALVVALAALTAATEPAPGLVTTAPRRAADANVARVWTVGAFGSLLLVASDPTSPAAVLAVALLIGEGLLSAALVGYPNFWVVPVAHVAAAITLGAVSRDEIAAWAWFLRDDQTLLTAAASVVMGIVGTALWRMRLTRPE